MPNAKFYVTLAKVPHRRNVEGNVICSRPKRERYADKRKRGSTVKSGHGLAKASGEKTGLFPVDFPAAFVML